MPTHTSAIQNLFHSIDRPIIDQITTQLVDQGVLLRPAHLIRVDTIHSTRRVSNLNTQYPGELALVTSMQMVRLEQADWALKRRWLYLPPLFNDPNLGVRIFAMTNNYEIQITFTYLDDNLEILRSLREGLLVKRDLGYTGSSHTLDYTLIPSKDTTELLRTIHELREAKHGYGEEYEEWMNLYSAPDYHPVQAGRHIEMSFAARQVNIEGGLYGEIANIEEYELGIYSFAINYTFHFARPIALITNFPVLIHQQLLPRIYTLTNNLDHQGYGFTDLPVVKAITEVKPRLPLRIPQVDLGHMENFKRGYQPLWVVLLAIEDLPIVDNVLCVLDRIDDLAIHPDIVKYLKEVGYVDLTTPYACPFLLSLHRNEQLMDSRYLEVNADLEVRLTHEIDLRNIYRLSFSILRDLPALNANCLPAVNQYGLNQIIADTLNMFKNETDYPRNEIVVPRDLTDIGYCRTLAPLLQDWQTNPSPYHRNRRGAVTTRTIMSSWVTSKRLY